jgi:hypothetical protein
LFGQIVNNESAGGRLRLRLRHRISSGHASAVQAGCSCERSSNKSANYTRADRRNKKEQPSLMLNCSIECSIFRL